jgi:hypothetical protein
MDIRKSDHRSSASEKSLLEKQTLRVAIASTIVAVAAAGAAIWSSIEAHQARVEDGRPMLTANPPQPQPDATPFMPIAISNVGKSTAKNVRISYKCALETNNATNFWQPEKLKTPGVTYPYIYPAGAWIVFRCPTPTQSARASSGTVVELGVIQYQDLSDRTYLSPFCLQFPLPGPRVDVVECPPGRKLPDPE